MPDRLAILIGNGRFEAEPSLPQLFGPRHDVAAFGRLLSDPDIGNYVVFELVGRDSNELLAEVEPLLATAVEGSNVLVYYAGCVVSEPGRGLYLATADTRLSSIKDTALPISALKGLMRRCAATEMTVILDCCYAGPAGGVDETQIEHELRRVRTDVSPDLHLIASRAQTQSAGARETATQSGLEGAMTRCIIEGLSTGAADRDGDNSTKASELNEYLGMRMGDARPLWAGPLGGIDPEIVANPNPIDGIGTADYDAMQAAAQAMRRFLYGLAMVAVIAAAIVSMVYFFGGEETRRVAYLEQEYAGTELPESVGLFHDVARLRSVIDRTGWVEHVEPLDGAGPRYPGAVSFRLDPGNSARPGTVTLHLRQWAQVEFGEGVHGFGVVCAGGLNIGELLVELVNGDQFVIDVRTEHAGDEFLGVVARMPINRMRITSTSTRFAADTLYVYADREYPRLR